MNNTTPHPVNRTAAILAIAMLAASIALGAFWAARLDRRVHRMEAELAVLHPQTPQAQHVRQALRQLEHSLAFDWGGLAAAAVAGVLLVVAWREPRVGPWAAAAAAVPIVYLILDAATPAVSLELLPSVRFLAALAALGPYLVLARPLAGRMAYGLGVGCLAVAAGFFLLWEPPPPTPVPIAKSLDTLGARLVAKMPGWTFESTRLPPDIEASLGADEYANLKLKSPDGQVAVTVFVTYNANAMSNIPHVPWVCMTQAGYRLVQAKQDDVMLTSLPGREIKPNVLLFEPENKAGRGDAQSLMFQYFNVGGTYEADRTVARFIATSGSLGQTGSYISQTQVAVPVMAAGDDPLGRNSAAYQIGVKFLNAIVPLLEGEYYPNLHGTEGG